MIGSLDPSKKANWKSYVSPLVFAYNPTRHESTGQSPFMLMFGRNPRLPIDAALGLRKNQQDITTTFITELKDRVGTSYLSLAGFALCLCFGFGFLGAGVDLSLMKPIGSRRFRWSVLVRPSLFSFLTLNTGIPSLGWL
jgi:hypothetical protein